MNELIKLFNVQNMKDVTYFCTCATVVYCLILSKR